MKLLCSNGVKAVMLDLLPGFERESGAKAEITWASTNMLMDEIAKGASGDLTILTDEAIDTLIAQGKVKPVIYKTFPLNEAAAAHALMESSAHIGKIVLTL
jgi:NADPH:quinone reductase-like Zn-dependent oxidoreductase